ncbi:hypothetical protein [Nostoc sp.]|uniref:hypothetical protein n=1 Tax=Nostoc sp. TaxID=1180 RepID=UPI002FF685BF
MLKNKSNFLHRENGFLKQIATRSPLVDYSKLLLSKKQNLFPETFLGWENWETQSQDYDLQSIPFEPLNLITEENSKDNTNDERKDSETDILTSKNTSKINDKIESNLRDKSKLPTQLKSKTKSKNENKQSVKLPVENKVGQAFNESKSSINLNQDRLLTVVQPFDSESQIDTFDDNHSLLEQQRDLAGTNIKSDNEGINSTPITAIPTSPNFQEEPFSNLGNDQAQVFSELTSTLPSAELATTAKAANVLQNTALTPKDDLTFNNTTNEPTTTTPIVPNIGETLTLQSPVSPHYPISHPEGIYNKGEFPTAVASQPKAESSISDISPNIINRNTSSENQLNIPEKPQSKEQNKTPRKPKSRKSLSPVKSPVNNQVDQVFDKNKPSINLNQDRLLTVVQPFDSESKIDTSEDNPSLLEQHRNLAGTNIKSDNEGVNSTPITAIPTSPNFEEQPFSNLGNDQAQVFSELTSTLPSAELATTAKAADVLQNTALTPKDNLTFNNITNEPTTTTPIVPNIGETLTLQSHVTPHHPISHPEGIYNKGELPTPIASQPKAESSISDISPNIINNNTSGENQLNIPEKPQSKEEDKTPRKPKSRKSLSPAKSPNQESVKSPVNNQVDEVFNKNKPSINLNQDRLLTTNQAFDSESKIHEFNNNSPALQQHKDSDNTSATSDNNDVSNMLIGAIPTSPNFEEEPFSNLGNDQAQVFSELTSTLPSTELATTVNATDVLENIVLAAENLTINNISPKLPQHNADSPTSRISEGKKPQTSSIPLQAATELDSGRIETIGAKVNAPDLISNSTRKDAIASNFIENAPTLLPHPTNSDLPSIVPNFESSEIVNDSAIAQNNINANITPSQLTNIPILTPPTSPATSDAIVNEVKKSTEIQSAPTPETFQQTAELAETTQLFPATTPETVEKSTFQVVENTSLPSAAITPNVFSNLINDKQVISDLPSPVTNTDISTTINISDNPERFTPPQNQEDSSPNEAKAKIDPTNMPVPQGFATGGHVTTTYVNNNQQVAPSDTVAAMLTPGEFVINARDAQKNLNTLKHINSGGITNDTNLTDLETSNPKKQKQTTSVESSTKVDSLQDTSLQPKNSDNISSKVSNSLISPSLGLDIGKQRRSMLSSRNLNQNVNITNNASEHSFHYSSPSLIFQPKNSSASTNTNTPSEWSSVEELLNGSTGVESNGHLDSRQVTSHTSESPKVFTRNLVQPKGFADGGEVNKADINTKKQPITDTIKRPSPSSKKQDDNANLEALAREIYSRLRQRIEIERERNGIYSGRLPW